MCRSSSELFTTLAGTGVASAFALFKAHWDMLRDRKAFRDAKKRESDQEVRNNAVDDSEA